MLAGGKVKPRRSQRNSAEDAKACMGRGRNDFLGR